MEQKDWIYKFSIFARSPKFITNTVDYLESIGGIITEEINVTKDGYCYWIDAENNHIKCALKSNIKVVKPKSYPFQTIMEGVKDLSFPDYIKQRMSQNISNDFDSGEIIVTTPKSKKCEISLISAIDFIEKKLKPMPNGLFLYQIDDIPMSESTLIEVQDRYKDAGWVVDSDMKRYLSSNIFLCTLILTPQLQNN